MGAPAIAVLFVRLARTTVGFGPTAEIERIGFQPRRVRAPGRIPGPGPGCGLGPGESVGSAHAGVGRGPLAGLGRKNSTERMSFFLFSISSKYLFLENEEMVQKKNRKSIFYLWVKFKKLM